MPLQVTAEADLKGQLKAHPHIIVIEAEGVARGGEREEFAVVFAEVFWADRPHELEPVLLPTETERLGIGGTDPEADMGKASQSVLQPRSTQTGRGELSATPSVLNRS